MRFASVLETVLCCDPGEREAMHEFYEGVLGLSRVASWETGTAYRVGTGVLLVFDRRALGESSSPVSAHGTDGPGHVCLRAAGGQYDGVRERIAEAAEITHDHEWPGGGRSFYFEDPAGNLLEVADCDLWPR